MKLNFLKKIIASTMLFSLTFSAAMGVLDRPQIVQADDFDDKDDRNDVDDKNDIDDRYVSKGTIPISGTTSHMGRKAVSLEIPKGIKVKSVDVENAPHDDIDDAIVNGKIVIYGLRDGVTYQNLVLVLEDYQDRKYGYRINSFSLKGSGATSTGNVSNTANKQAVIDYLKKVYTNIFSREVDAQGLNYWTQKLSSGQIELEDFFKNLLSEAEFMQVAPKVEDKINKLYEGIFQRKADKGGLDFWTAKYKQELREEGSEKEALRDVIDEMTGGEEFKQLLARLGLDAD